MRRWFGVVLVSLLAAGCAAGAPAPVANSTTAEANSTPPAANSTTAEANSTTPAANSTTPAAEPAVVVLDPGHNGGNAGAQAQISRQVPAGRGRTKPCNTTGTATAVGYPEHRFTFDVAQRVRRLLAARGITVVLTRTNDASVGPCVNRCSG